jgi:hypothetical protein
MLFPATHQGMLIPLGYSMPPDVESPRENVESREPHPPESDSALDMEASA